MIKSDKSHYKLYVSEDYFYGIVLWSDKDVNSCT
jgi:hypothetical protein